MIVLQMKMNLKNKLLAVMEKIKDFFRKKEYYAIDINSLNILFDFKKLNNCTLNEIEKYTNNLNESTNFNNRQSKLHLKDAIKFSDIRLLLECIKAIIEKDYEKTYIEAINHQWDFLYLVTNEKYQNNDSLFVNNKLSSLNKETGDIIYSFVLIRKYKDSFYLWCFLEDYDGYI